MHIDLSKTIKEAMEAPIDAFNKTVEDATQTLRNEDGKVGNLQIIGRLIKTKHSGEALVVGDLHGDLESLIHTLQESKILHRMALSASAYLIFLGDYGDRGDLSSEVIYTVLKLKLQLPTQVVLMRGNHEGPKDLLASPHDLPAQLHSRFGEKWPEAYNRISDLFQYLYTSVLVEDRFLIVHGGLPEQVHAIEDFAYAHKQHPKTTLLEDMLWSDPIDSFEGVYPSPRGAGKLFGADVTAKVLKMLNVPVLIRGHESCSEGFKFNHEGKVLTLFSRRGPPYFNAFGAYLDVNLSEQFQNAEQLSPHIHKF